MRLIDAQALTNYEHYLIEEEKSQATQQKYLHDVRAFAAWLGERELAKTAVLDYKAYLQTVYAPVSVNSMLSSLNSFFAYREWYDLRVKTLKIQRQVFLPADRELTRAEYERLLAAAQKTGRQRLFWLMQTVCATGIRISELAFITAEAVGKGYADISCKGKRRRVFLPSELCGGLKRYMAGRGIKKGPVFITRNGKPVDRSNVWSEMKAVCSIAGVMGKKVFPHNLRHLFARVYYSLYKDIARLADILGHSNINTTRIYTMESGEVHKRQVQRMGLLWKVPAQKKAT